MSKIARRRVAPLTFVAGLVLGGFVAVAVVADASSSPATYYGCLSKGLLTKVSTKAHSCGSAKRVSWNAVGPKGATGPNGARGLQGVEGVQGVQGRQGVQGPPGPTYTPAEIATLDWGRTMTYGTNLSSGSTRSTNRTARFTTAGTSGC